LLAPIRSSMGQGRRRLLLQSCSTLGPTWHR